MYEEKKKNYSLKDLAIQLLFIVLFVLILLWLFPTKKNMKNYVDKNGNNKPEATDKANNKDNNKGNNKKEQLYEYKKDGSSYSDWSEYSEWQTEYVEATDLVDVQTEVRSYKTGTTNKQVQTGTQEVDYLVGTVTDYKSVAGYLTDITIKDYVTQKVKVGEAKVQVGSKTEITYEKVQTGTVEEYVETKSGAMVPANTDEYVYKQTNVIEEKECATCPVSKAYVYDVYKIKPVYTVKEVENVIPIYELQDVYETRQVPVYAFNHNNVYETKTEDVYSKKQVPVYETKTEDTYGSVTYYRYRTRKKLNNNVDIKYSTSADDQELINQGYKYTGNVKNA